MRFSYDFWFVQIASANVKYPGGPIVLRTCTLKRHIYFSFAI
jgi:hypothetical protein